MKKPFTRSFALTLLAILSFAGIGRPQSGITITDLRHDSMTTLVTPQKVAPFGKTIFVISRKVGPFTPLQRAKSTEQRLLDIAEDPLFNADSLKLYRSDISIDLYYKDLFLMAITEQDAAAENISQDSLAVTRLRSVSHAVIDYRKVQMGKNLVRDILFAGAVLLILMILTWLVNWLFRFINRRILSWEGDLLEKLHIQKSELFNKPRQISFLKMLNKVFRFVLLILLIILALFLMFYILPWTKGFTIGFLRYFLSPISDFVKSIYHFLPNLIIIIVFIFIARLVIKFFRFLKREVESSTFKIPGFYPDWAVPTFNIIRLIIWAFTLIVIWPYLPGSDSKVFQGVSVFVGILFSITSASSLSNIMAGFSLTYTRAFRMGDRVRIGEITGDVVEKTMLVTKLQTIKNEVVTIPNSKIMGGEVVNYSTMAGESGLILYTSITIGYDAPWKTVHELLIRAAERTTGILKDPKPFVLQTSLDDSYVSYQINAFTDDPWRMIVIYSDLHQNIQDSFNEAGVEIMSPGYHAVRDGNTTTIPPSFRSKDYQPGSFRVGK